MKKIAVIVTTVLALAGCQDRNVFALPSPTPATTATPAPTISPEPTVSAPPFTATPKPSPRTTPTPQPTLTVTPSQAGVINLKVPFGSQAPYAVWDDLHNEACEEAAMLMASAYFKNESITPHVMEQGILNLVKWEEKNGYTVDVTAQQTVDILQAYFQLPARLMAAPTKDGMVAELLAGRLVIVPAAGRKLGNPNFRRPGPLYHMLVLRGYDPQRNEFITNDPGTRKGEGYRYKTAVLLAAIHDWPKLGKTKADVSEAEMEAGQKVGIIVGE